MTPGAKGVLGFLGKARSLTYPRRADVGGKSGKVGVGVTGRTPAWPRRGMFLPRVVGLGTLGGCDPPSPRQDSEDSGITDSGCRRPVLRTGQLENAPRIFREQGGPGDHLAQDDEDKRP